MAAEDRSRLRREKEEAQEAKRREREDRERLKEEQRRRFEDEKQRRREEKERRKLEKEKVSEWSRLGERVASEQHLTTSLTPPGTREAEGGEEEVCREDEAVEQTSRRHGVRRPEGQRRSPHLRDHLLLCWCGSSPLSSPSLSASTRSCPAPYPSTPASPPTSLETPSWS